MLREVGAPFLLAPIQETLSAFRIELEAKFERVNQRVENGDNKHLKVTGIGDKRRWSLMYPTDEEPINSPFYGQLPGIGIADLLWFVAGKTNFLSAFTHVLERYIKQDVDPRLILACVVAMGTNMGLWKMAEVSGLSYSSLLTTARNFLRAEMSRCTLIADWRPISFNSCPRFQYTTVAVKARIAALKPRTHFRLKWVRDLAAREWNDQDQTRLD